MLMIRLRRMGARNRPYYRVVVSDSRRTARAEVLEELGSYDPVPSPPALSLDEPATGSTGVPRFPRRSRACLDTARNRRRFRRDPAAPA